MDKPRTISGSGTDGERDSKDPSTGPRNSRKRRRTKSTPSLSTVYDMMVPLPREAPLVHIPQLQQRLASLGYTHMALAHTIYGIPKPHQDEVERALPATLWLGDSTRKKEAAKKGVAQTPTIQVLRRLNAVIENLSDLAHYAQRNPQVNDNPSQEKTIVASDAVLQSCQILQEYDVVSLSARNEAVFSAMCKSALACDIIVLDYTAGRGGVQLPFKIKNADVKAATDRQAVFELAYAPAILNRSQRKGLIQTCRQLQLASLSSRQTRILISSGSRQSTSTGADDMGVMALRSPADIQNVADVILQLDSRRAFEALHTTGDFVLEQAQQRRFGRVSGNTKSRNVSALRVKAIAVLESENSNEEKPEVAKPRKRPVKKFTNEADTKRSGNKNNDIEPDDKGSNHSEDENDEDGFIAF